MTSRLFGIDLAGEINNALGSGLLAATLIKVTAGTRTTGTQAAGTNPTTSSYTCRGFIESYSQYELAGTMVLAQDKKIGLLGASISGGTVFPEGGDRVTIEGATYEIVGVPQRDPAGALYICQCRR